MPNKKDGYIKEHPTIIVTFIINEENLEKSTYLVDFDKRLHIKEDAWDELNKKTKLMSMIDNLKIILPQLMINKEI